MNRAELVSLFWCSLAVLVLLGVVVATIRMGLDEQREKREQCDCASAPWMRTELQATNIQTGEPWVCPVCGDDGTIRWKEEREQ